MPVRLTVWSPGSSPIVKLAIASRVGTWLIAATVTTKDWLTVLAVLWPSLTVTVIVAVPDIELTGVKESVPVVEGLE